MSRVQSIERAFAVLDALVDGPLGVTEVAARAGVPKSTAARLLNALQTEGAVEQLPGDTRYRLGRRLAVLASGLRDTRGLVAVARPTLVELADATGEATGLSVADGFTVHYVDQVDSPNPVQGRDWTGSPAPSPPRSSASPRARSPTRAPSSSACARCAGTAAHGCARSSPRASRPWRRRWPPPGAGWWPPSTSTGRRTASLDGGPRTRSPGASSRPPPGSLPGSASRPEPDPSARRRESAGSRR